MHATCTSPSSRPALPPSLPILLLPHLPTPHPYIPHLLAVLLLHHYFFLRPHPTLTPLLRPSPSPSELFTSSLLSIILLPRSLSLIPALTALLLASPLPPVLTPLLAALLSYLLPLPTPVTSTYAAAHTAALSALTIHLLRSYRRSFTLSEATLISTLILSTPLFSPTPFLPATTPLLLAILLFIFALPLSLHSPALALPSALLSTLLAYTYSLKSLHTPFTYLLTLTLTHLPTILYWLFLLLITLSPSTPLPSLPKPLLRKAYHILLILIIHPPFPSPAPFLLFALSVALALLLLSLLLPNQPIFSSALRDSKDLGPVPLTPLYLLLGASLPILTSAPLAGAATVGVLDAAAAAVGSLVGKRRWRPSDPRTIEGSFAGFFAGAAYLAAVRGSVTRAEVGALAATAVLEATTDQIDNLVLSAFFVASVEAWG